MRSALLVTELFPPDIGGSAELFENIYKRLRVPRVEVLTNSSTSEVTSAFPNVAITRIPMRWTSWGLTSRNSLKTHVTVANAIARARRDGALIHCGRILPEGLAALMAWPAGRRPFICWAHGEEIQYVNSSKELRLLFRIVQHRAAGILANSRHTAQLLEQMGVAAHKIRVAYPGVDTNRFVPTARAADIRHELLRDERLLFLTVGRLQRRKGHDVTLRALRSLVGAIPSFRYAIVGAGPEAETLRALVRELDMGSLVIFRDSISHQDLPAYYQAADIFVHPNRVDGLDFEGFGIVFLEAAASGLVTVGGRSGGVPEAIADNVTGLLVDGDDVGDVANVIKRLSLDLDLRKRLGRQARERVRQSFTWEHAADIVLRAHLDCAE